MFQPLRSGLLLALLSLPLLTATVSCSKKEDATPAPAAPTTGGLTGTVSPADALTAVTATDGGGLTFVARPAAGTGVFSLADLTPGSYTLSFTPASGYDVPARRTVTVVAGQIAQAGVVAVAPEPRGVITGTVAPADAVTRVEVVSGTGAVSPATPGATTGAFSFGNLALGTYTVRFVVAPGYAAVPDQANVQLTRTTTPLNLGTIAVQRNSIALTATLNGSQSVPANASSATGTFVGTYSPTSQQLTYTVTYQGIAPTNAHLHAGAPGAAGPVSISFASFVSPIQGTATLTAGQANDLLNNRMYVNLHTAAFPGGEIRGNIHQ